MLQCGILGAAHLPIVLGILFTINLVTTYIMAVLRSDVEAIFPYVSATADHRPESCFFSLLLNICAILLMVVMYLRYSLIAVLIRDSDKIMDMGNLTSFCVGMVGGFAMLIVANFQETAIIGVHLLAACICFGSGCVYTILQSWITLRMHPLYTNRRIGVIRAIIAAIATASFIIAISCGTYAAHEFHRYYPNLPTPRPWNRKVWQPGYNFHVMSALAEWIMAVAHVSFILTYARDFEKIRVSLYIESLVSHLDHSPLVRSLNDMRDL
ncbi:hypothetical protein KIN20_018005 [Parelaphostrongylus tenuis]|uniref:CWH43-like N-terminal domain-containing protein n=1 Tax=Parelaphostrongylus tenuis TaxID=148309 RepID=A0AAD5MIT8_PARTN|nr:hypothetical protein KIN20_018005 [Parelaphostrongylus tenuis]